MRKTASKLLQKLFCSDYINFGVTFVTTIENQSTVSVFVVTGIT